MRKMKRALALLLVLTLALSLAACGKKEGGAAPKPTDTPETVYAAEYKELLRGSQSMQPMLYTEDGFYCSVYERISDEAPEEGTMAAAKGLDGTYEFRLYFVSFDGQLHRLEKYAPVEPQLPEGEYSDVYSSGSINGLVLNEDGSLQLVENCFTRYYAGPADLTMDDPGYYDYVQYEDAYFIRSLDKDGAELSSARIETPENGYLNIYNMVSDGQGNLLTTDDSGLMAIASDGSIAYTIPLDTWADNLVQLKDGRIGVLYYEEDGYTLHVVDPGTKSLGESYTVPNTAWDLVSGSGDYDLYYTSGINLYGLKLDGSEPVRLVTWLNLDVDSDSLGPITVREDGTILGVLNTWDSNYESVTTELMTVRQVPYDSVPHKQSLSLAVFNLDYQLRQQIINFNRKNEKYHIDVTDYAEYSTDEDYTAGLTKLTTEIMSGKVPDLMDMSGLPYEQLANKGLLEDLYPYIDADADFGREDFFSSVFSALEVNGGLYKLSPSFSIYTVIGAKSVVGDTPGWTFDQFDAALATMPEGCDPFDYSTTKDEMLTTCLDMDLDSFIDWSTGTCRFDSPEFIRLLQFCNRFLDEFDWEHYEYNDEDMNTETRIAAGRQMLLRASIYSLQDVIYNDFYFGGDGTSSATTYIGYPTSSGAGNAMQFQMSLGMSSRCADKEGAWSFMRLFLEDEFQNSLWYLPVKRSVFEEKLAELMEPRYQKDENGDYVTDENGEKIMVPLASWGFEDGTIREIYQLSEAQAQNLRDLIESTTKDYSSNEAVSELITNEAKPFFLGQKSAEEVARLIQSKVNIYVNEQR